MDLNELLDQCTSLESTVIDILEHNSIKNYQAYELHSEILRKSISLSEDFVKYESGLQKELDILREKKIDLEHDIEQYTTVNEKLREWLASARDGEHEICTTITTTLQSNEYLKEDFRSAFNSIIHLNDYLVIISKDIADCVKQNQDMIGSIEKNNHIIRVLEQQNRYGEQQFDLIINLIPWEPLTRNYIDELREYDTDVIRNLAGVLEVQAQDINDLNESLLSKKERKLEILDQLANHLNHFIRKRDEALMMISQKSSS